MAVTQFDLYRIRKPHAARKHHGCVFCRTRLLSSIEVSHCENNNFLPFWLMWPWPWPDNLYIRTYPIFPGDIPPMRIWTSYVKAFESYRLTDKADMTKITTTLRQMLHCIVKASGAVMWRGLLQQLGACKLTTSANILFDVGPSNFVRYLN